MLTPELTYSPLKQVIYVILIGAVIPAVLLINPIVEANPGQLKWKYETGGPIGSSPAIGLDGTIYIGSDDGHLYALNPSGILKWKYEIGDNEDSHSPSPTIASDGTIYVGSWNKYLYAIDKSGILKWKYKINAPSRPSIGSDGTIYVGSRGKYLYAIDPSGILKWKYETGDNGPGSPAIGLDGTIYVGSYNEYLYAINSDGSLKWKFEVGLHDPYSPVIGKEGTIYCPGKAQQLYAIDQSGNLKRKYEIGYYALYYSSPAIASDGTIYIGTINFGDSNLYALDQSGNLKWKYETEDDIINSSSAIASDGTIYVGSIDSNLYALDQSGNLKWKYGTGGPIDSSPAIGLDGTIYIGSDDGHLYALEGTGGGLANSPWPMFGKDLRHTSNKGEDEAAKESQSIPFKGKGLQIKSGETWEESILISKDTKGFIVKTDFTNSWDAELSYASKFPDLDITLISPSGKKYYSELVEVKQLSDSRTEGKEKLTEGVSVLDPEPGKWDLKVESNSSKKWNTKTFELNVEEMGLDKANIQAKIHDPFYLLNKVQEGKPQKGKTLAYLRLKKGGQNKYNLEIFPNLGVSVPSLDSEKYPGVKGKPVGLMIVGYAEDSFDRVEGKGIEDIFYSLNGEDKPTTSPSKSMQEKVAVAAVKDITGLVPGLGLLQSNTVQLALETILGDFVEDTKPAENYHVPTAKAFKTDNGFDHYVKTWSAQEFEADYGDSVTIPFGLKFDQEGKGKRTFVLYIKLILAHDSLGETSKPKKGPKLFEESVELKVTVDENGKVKNVDNGTSLKADKTKDRKIENSKKEPTCSENTREQLYSLARENLRYAESEDLQGYMSTMHSKAPNYSSMKQTLRQLFMRYDLNYELQYYEYLGRDGEYALLKIKQLTEKVSGPSFRNNIVESKWRFKKEDGEWKIWSTTPLNITYI